MATRRTGRSVPPALVALFAVACGLSVANLYYAQPMLAHIAQSFGASPSTAGLVVTFAQVGYALGLGFLVPLGDLFSRRRLVPVVLSVTALGLVASALAPSISVLISVAVVVGLGSVAAQMLIPMAASLASDHDRGHVVGGIMSGLLIGILLARTAAGALAAVTSWRVVFAAASGVTVLLAIVLARVLPEEHPRPTMTYRALLHSGVTLLRAEPQLRRRAVFGGLAFAAFSVFWTTMAFLLSTAPFHENEATIGLFGLVGASGALIANFAGKWADRGWTSWTTFAFSVLIALSFGVLWIGRASVAMVVVGILALDVGVQGLQVTNQSIIFRLAPEARSRINSVYMVSYFTGGAAGSALGSAMYGAHRWAGVCALGVGIGALLIGASVVDGVRSRT